MIIGLCGNLLCFQIHLFQYRFITTRMFVTCYYSYVWNIFICILYDIKHNNSSVSNWARGYWHLSRYVLVRMCHKTRYLGSVTIFVTLYLSWNVLHRNLSQHFLICFFPRLVLLWIHPNNCYLAFVTMCVSLFCHDLCYCVFVTICVNVYLSRNVLLYICHDLYKSACITIPVF